MVTSLGGQQQLSPFLTVECSGCDNGAAAFNPTSPRPCAAPLSSQDAVEYFGGLVRCMQKGTLFTSMSLFAGVQLRGDKRARGAVIKSLQRLGLITVDGITTQDQEGRNGGYAVLWRVV